jgi:hypothetical protein
MGTIRSQPGRTLFSALRLAAAIERHPTTRSPPEEPRSNSDKGSLSWFSWIAIKMGFVIAYDSNQPGN